MLNKKPELRKKVMNMKIAFIGQKGIPAHVGGIERYAEDLALELIKSGQEVIAYTRPHYTPKNQKEYKDIKLVSLPSIRTKHLDAIIHSLLASVHVIFSDVDIVHYQNIGPALTSWIPRIFKRRVKIVSTFQTKDYEHAKWGIFARTMLRLGELTMILFSHEIIVVSEEMKEYVIKKYGIEPHFITNGAREVEIKKAKEIKKWGLRKNNYIFSASRLVRHKGIHHLINAFKKIKTDKVLVIAGDGAFTDDYVAELKKLAKGKKNIIFTGNQTGDTLDELFSNAYLFVQPSLVEGLSLALLEAMAFSRPLLVSDIGANKEAAGDAGVYFKSDNAKDLKEKLLYILSHPRIAKAKGKEGNERVKSDFNWETITERILGVYHNAGNNKKSSKIKLLIKYLKLVRA